MATLSYKRCGANFNYAIHLRKFFPRAQTVPAAAIARAVLRTFYVVGIVSGPGTC